MEKKIFLYLRFKPTESPDKALITQVSQCPLDYIFTPTSSQDEVYTKFKYIGDDLLMGKSACIILIGSEGSGKAYSIFGKFPAHNGIITRITEEVLQHDTNNHLKLFFVASDINGNSLIEPKKNSEDQLLLRFESNLLEISNELSTKTDSVIIYKLILNNSKSNQESSATIVCMNDSVANIHGLSSFIRQKQQSHSKVARILFSLSTSMKKVCVLFCCREERKEVDMVKNVLLDKPIDASSSDSAEQTPLDEVETLKKRIIELEKELKDTNDKLIESELKAHEYYQCYHKTLLLINKDSAQNVFLNSQNESLIRQIRKETSILQTLESKYQNLFDTCTKSHESTYIEFDSVLDPMMRSDNSIELNATDTLNLGISQVKLSMIPDPLLFTPYTSEIKQALEGNSELNKEIQILQLKNQLIEASVINANMSRTLSSFDWKFAILKHRYEMKRLLCKQQQDRIKSLEEMLEYLHTSLEQIKKRGKYEEGYLDKLFDKYCYKAIVDSQRTVAEYKKSMQSIEGKVTEAHRRESQKWMELLNEHKENYEKELRRKQCEVIRLNELLGKWINKYMELQESLSNPEKPLSIIYYSQIQELIHESISLPQIKLPEKQMTPKAKTQNASQKFGAISGDNHPPM